ncbi:MAG: clan AA aspartic protease [bacterium]|nr:clan AA aspartic protease [bacterium]
MKLLTAVIILLSLLVSSGFCFDLDSLLALSVGGPDGLRTVQTMSSFKATGEIILNGQRGRFIELVAPPNRIYYSLIFPQFGITQGYDGQEAWQSDLNGRVSKISGFEKKELLKTLYLESYSHLVPGRMPGTATYLKDTVADGVTYHLVEYYPFMQDTLRVLYEQGSGYRSVQVSYMDNICTMMSLGSYEIVQSVPLAMRQISVAIGVPLTMEMVVDTALFNEPIDLSVFSPPGLTELTLPGGVDSILIPFVLENGHIYVQGTINGKKRVRLILDSGASATIFNSPVVAEMELQVVGSMPARGVAGYVETKLVRSDSLTVGEITLYGQIGGMADLSVLRVSQSDTIPFGGIIGYDFLSRFPIQIDYQRNQLVVYDPSRFVAPSGGHIIPFNLTMQVPTVDIVLAGAKGRFLIDLGNALGLILHNEFAQRNKLDTLPRLGSQDRGKLGGIGGGVGGEWVVVPELRVGSLTLSEIPAILSASSAGITGSYEIEGNIGNELLRSYKVVFDYQHQMLYLLPPGE